MCEYFVKADPIQFEQRSRTIRIHGVLTSIRLENMVWDTLAEMAEEEGRTTNNLIVQFHDEILAHRGEVPNFASFLRVTCMRYLRRKLTQAERAVDREGALVRPNAVSPAQVAQTTEGLPSARVVAMGRRT
ncbi:ribbon-helix-helix domain-containing protein [Ideonella sp. A 288]|uniref:ribbon-helix-helix domain-containing protein n=1 Tax=Ideonella sp. A 288 TaxID=1962181 RepID=UPI000B4B695D|nr:ribbon-helix-helix domain-containing protein [Ideonella sp. A 288]